MTRIVDRTFSVNAAPDVAWKHLAAVESWPTWAGHIRSVRLDPPGPIGPSTRGRFVLSNRVRSSFVMAEMVPGVHWRWDGGFLWARISYDHRFEPRSDGGTTLTWTVDASGWAIGALGAIFGRIYNRNLDRAIPRLTDELGGAPAS